jgi:mannosyltransferase
VAAVTAPHPPSTRTAEARDSGREFDLRVPGPLSRYPYWLLSAVVLVLVMIISGVLRSRHLGSQFWMDEGLSVGISTHALVDIPHVLRHDGSPPLYYMLLHCWMSVFGSTESSTHGLSLIFGLLTIPVGAWLATSLFGRWAGVIATVLFALNPFITAYSQETRMYSLMALLGLLATAGFIHGFIFRRRRFLILFAVCQTLMLYTHAWGIFFGVGGAIAFAVVWRASDDRRALLIDGLLSFGIAAVLYLPWLPTLLYQASHTGSPWDSAPNFGAPVQISRNLLGGDRATVALFLAGAIGVAALLYKGRWRTRESLVVWTLILLPVGTLGFGWIVSHFSPAWAYRYFAPTIGALLLVATAGMARAKGVGLLALVLVIIFWANPSSFTPKHKSDMREVAAEMAPQLHRGDIVILGQPEQVPLAWYYLPAGLRFASTSGTLSDPQSMNWVDALTRLQDANPNTTLNRLIATLRPNQQVLFVRPLTEGAQNWQAPWTKLVRRRSAQWGALLASDPSLKPVAWAPHNYRGSCCVADSALLYRKL